MTWTAETPAHLWLAAARLCAVDGIWCFWNEEGDALSLELNCNDHFGPAADGEEVTPDIVLEVLDAVRGQPDANTEHRAAMEWIAKRRGYADAIHWREKLVKP